MSNFQAQLQVNNIPLWEDSASDYVALLARLLTQLEAEPTGAVGFIRETPTHAIIFRCRKVSTE